MSRTKDKRQQTQIDRRRQQTRERLTLIAIITFLVVIVAAALIIPQIQRENSARAQITTHGIAYTASTQNSLGDPNAPVKVVEYSDFQCIHCKTFALEEESALLQYVEEGKVYFTYMPVDMFGPISETVSEAAYCAADQGKFFEYRDVIFLNLDGNRSETYSAARLADYAEALGLERKSFETCLKDRTYDKKATQNFAEARSGGVEGTPAFVIGGKVVYKDQLLSTINQALLSVP